MARITKSIQFGDQILTLETGEIARQADSAVLVSMQDTVVLVTVVSKPQEGFTDFFPLTVHYQEKSYAAGRIPGGFIKREGRPSENEVLISRLLDRPIRPLFPKGFNTEIQVLATVLSFNPSVNPDILSMVGASAALTLASHLPFGGPIGAARVGYKDGIYLLNPAPEALATSELDLVVAGTENAVLMVESEADELSESVMLGAVVYGHTMMQEVIKGIREFVEQAHSSGGTRVERTNSWQPLGYPTELVSTVKQSEADIAAAYQIADKHQRRQKLQEIREYVLSNVKSLESDSVARVEKERLAHALFNESEKDIVRNRILTGEPRIDGRDTKTVRPIQIRLGLLPRTHGSSLFTRGETQAIVVTTLGSDRDAQTIDSIHGEAKQRFMLHYNFPPYSVGEVGMVAAPKRREIGHGRLAWRALSAVIPAENDFPYVIRVVSEITESNGSSSMATVCGASLALMDAGIPIKAPVAGIAMGLVKEGEQFKVLTDILGDEDHLGDMDFKVAGTEKGVTALQMDIKIDGITSDIMALALEQAQEARLHILNIMKQNLSKPREVISEYAPRITTMRVPVDKIGEIIGKGGSTIRALTEETGVSIDISDDGIVKVFAADQQAADTATKRIEQLIEEVIVGKIYEGRVTKIVEFGAFVNILPSKDGLLHISQITTERVKNVGDYLQEGQMIQVKVIEVDRQGRIKLSMKEVTVNSEA